MFRADTCLDRSFWHQSAWPGKRNTRERGIHKHIHTETHTYIYIPAHTHTYTNTYTHTHAHIHTHIHTFTFHDGPIGRESPNRVSKVILLIP